MSLVPPSEGLGPKEKALGAKTEALGSQDEPLGPESQALSKRRCPMRPGHREAVAVTGQRGLPSCVWMQK